MVYFEVRQVQRSLHRLPDWSSRAQCGCLAFSSCAGSLLTFTFSLMTYISSLSSLQFSKLCLFVFLYLLAL
jgi:hypothetical protein